MPVVYGIMLYGLRAETLLIVNNSDRYSRYNDHLFTGLPPAPERRLNDMPVSFDRFSDIASRAKIRDSGIVTVDSRHDLKLSQSRFRLVRWVADRGVGKRLQNRRSVGSFISSLQNHYGTEVTSRMDFRHLQGLQDKGKPLHVRDIKAAISEADMVADGVKLVKSSDIEGLMDERIAQTAYFTLPGGKDLAHEVRSKVDIPGVQQQFAQTVRRSSAQGALSGGGNLRNMAGWCDMAISQAQKDVFLTGYGVKTAHGQQFDRLQQIFDRHPQVQALYQQYGVKFSASRASGALYDTLSEKLSSKLYDAMHRPEQLPGEGPVRERVERAVNQVAEQVVDRFIRDRAEALERLHELHARGEIGTEDMGSFKSDSHRSLADVVLHHRIPASMLSPLNALRSRVPDNLGDLSSTDHSMEHKIQVLEQFGEALNGIYTDVSEADFEKYLSGEENKNSYTMDCGRFLLEGKLAADDEAAIRHAVITDPHGSGLLELCQGIADMRGATYGLTANDDHWAAAKYPLDKMLMAAMVLLGGDVVPPADEYTQGAANVLNALRNCGIDAPPPDEHQVEQSGKGAFSRPALEIAQNELEEDLAQVMSESKEHPGFPEEAITDFDRATYIIDDKTIERGDVDGVVGDIRNMCVDGRGNPDDRMLDIIGKLVYQRTVALGMNRFTSGMDTNENDTASLLKTAPFMGLPSAGFNTTYRVSKNDGGAVVHILCEGPANALNHPRGVQILDADRSQIAFDLTIEINARDYSAKLTGMNYEYRLVPDGKEP